MIKGFALTVEEDIQARGWAIHQQLAAWRFPISHVLIMRWPTTPQGQPFAYRMTFVTKNVDKGTLITPLTVTAEEVAARYHEHVLRYHVD